MDKEEQLDSEFRLGLNCIRLFLGELQPEDVHLCRSWLNKLYNSVNERTLRNSLLKSLIKSVKRGYLEHPFNKPPKRLPLSRIKPKCGGEGEYIDKWRNNSSSSTSFSSNENHTLRNAGYQTTDDSDAVFPQRIKSKRSEFSTLRCWKETLDDGLLGHENIDNDYEDRHTLTNTIATLKAQNEALTHEISLYQSTAETTCKELLNLNQEVICLKTKLSELQRINSNIERQQVKAIAEHKQVLTDSLLQVSENLKGVNEQNNELLNNVASMEFKLSHLNQQTEASERKLKSEMDLLKSQLAKERKRHENEIMVYENLLRNKNEQLKRVDCHVKMQCSKMQEEVVNIRQEMDYVTHESNSHLKAKISSFKRDIFKLEKANKKLIAEYECHLKSCHKNHQLQVKEFKSKHINKYNNSTELEKAVMNLDKKYRKLFLDLERKAVLQRQHDSQKIQQLEEELLRFKYK